jgi:AcrR family transcriptional regulator
VAPEHRFDELDAANPSVGRAGRTRRALLIAAADQFHAAGYQGASLDAIATRAAVSKGALYFHFAHKRALADAVIAEMNAIREAMIAEIAARGLDPLRTLLAGSDQVAEDLINNPVVRGGSRLLGDPLLRSAHTTQLAAEHYGHSEGATAAQLDAAAAAGLLRHELGAAQRVPLARSIVAAINGHQMICTLTDTRAELWDRLTDMWQHLLPLIATDLWLADWHASDWLHRPHPSPSTP